MINKIKIPLIALTSSAIVFWLEISSNFSIGEIIYKYFPCETDPMNSAPCFVIYDLYFGGFLLGVFVVSLIVIGFKIIKRK